MTPQAHQNCPDFGTSTGLPDAGQTTKAAWAEADARGLSDAAARRFSQGFIHARQGRTDLLGACPHYDAGHTAYPRGPIDQAVIRDCEADGAQPYAGAA